MKVLFICDEYPPGKNGGIGTMVQSLARALSHSGHQVFVVGMYSYAYGEKDFETDGSIKVWRLRYGFKLKEGVLNKILNKLPPLLKRILYGTKNFKNYLKFIENLIEQEQIQILEMPDWNTSIYNLGFVVKWPKLNIPMILKLHGSYTYFKNELNWQSNTNKEKIDEHLFNRADGIVAVSAYAANKNNLIFKSNKDIKVLYNSIDLPEKLNKPGTANKTVIFTGTLLAKKGIFQLIKAWNKVIKQIPDAQLLIFGKGRTDVLEKLLSPEAKLSVHFKGHVSRMYLLDELANARMAVFPSYSETFGLMCIEAMSVGCPVIYTSLSCGPEIIKHNENGLSVDPDDINSIVESIITLFNDETKRQLFVTRGYDTVKNRFNIKQSQIEHINYYMQVIKAFNTN